MYGHTLSRTTQFTLYSVFVSGEFDLLLFWLSRPQSLRYPFPAERATVALEEIVCTFESIRELKHEWRSFQLVVSMISH